MRRFCATFFTTYVATLWCSATCACMRFSTVGRSLLTLSDSLLWVVGLLSAGTGGTPDCTLHHRPFRSKVALGGVHPPVACALAMSELEATLGDAAPYTYSLAAKCASEIIGTALVICELAWGETRTWRGRSAYRQGGHRRPSL